MACRLWRRADVNRAVAKPRLGPTAIILHACALRLPEQSGESRLDSELRFQRHCAAALHFSRSQLVGLFIKLAKAA